MTSMKITLIKICILAIKIFVLITALMSTWFYLNSQDSAQQDLGVFNKEPVRIADNENGFLTIDFGKLKSESIYSDYLDDDFTKRLVRGETWDQAYVNKNLEVFKDQILSLERSSEFTQFQLPVLDGLFGTPEYMPILSLAYLTLLKASNAIKNGNLEQAASIYEAMLKFTNNIKLERNGFLVSYMIGTVLQDETMMAIQQYLANEAITETQIQTLQALLNNYPSLEDEEFLLIILGEFHFARAFIDQLTQNETLKQRWYKFTHNEDVLAESWIFTSPLANKVVRFFRVFFPNFYVHRERSLANLSEFYHEKLEILKGACPYYTDDEFEYTQISLADALIPNSLGVKRSHSAPQFAYYFNRRCLSFTLLEATKAIAAIRLYKLKNNQLPQATEDLLSGYINALPVDYFTGKALSYSKENEWLYSYGFDGENGFGSAETFFHSACHQEECADNPTFPIDPLRDKSRDISDN